MGVSVDVRILSDYGYRLETTTKQYRGHFWGHLAFAIDCRCCSAR